MKKKVEIRNLEEEEKIGLDEIDEYRDLPELIEIDDNEIWNRDSLREKYFVDIIRTPNNERMEFETQEYIGIKRVPYDTKDRTHLVHLWLVIMYKARGVFKKPPYIALVKIDVRNWHPSIVRIKPEEIPPKTRVRLTATGEVITKVEIIPKSENSSVR